MTSLPKITGATAPSRPFCKPCRYCVISLRDNRSVAFCSRTDLVDGSGNNATTCLTERFDTSERACGLFGKYWEAP